MKVLRSLVFLLLLTLAFAGGSLHAGDPGVLFQYSTIQRPDGGVYDGDLTYGELAKHGDFGLGTFNALDGEMIALDGKFYQIKSDGVAYPVSDSMKTPFADVTFFNADQTVTIDEPLNFRQLEAYLEKLLPSLNLAYAVRIEGVFPYIKTRSVPRQQRPYPPLVEAAKNQTVFEFQNVKGVMVGFWAPKYLAGVNVAGYHLHFITADRQAGGHLLDCRVADARVAIGNLGEFSPEVAADCGVLSEGLAWGSERKKSARWRSSRVFGFLYPGARRTSCLSWLKADRYTSGFSFLASSMARKRSRSFLACRSSISRRVRAAMGVPRSMAARSASSSSTSWVSR